LACLVLRGKLSKGLVESLLNHKSHADIISAVNKLENKGLIKKSGWKPYARGRKQYYYKITEEGLKLLIIDDPHPLKFWKALLGYCHHDDVGLTSNKIDEFNKLFIEKYLKYRNYSFSFQYDIFDKMRDKWLQDFILVSKRISTEQKVIEVLSIYPNITFEKLVQKTRENKSDVSRILSTYTLESYKPLVIENEYYIDQNIIGKKYNKKYWDFILHNTIIIRQNSEGVKIYELSLFGVILALSIVRFYDMDKLTHGLYYGKISLPHYYDKIASNYKNRLPLIFGKWNLLKKVLKLFSAYNFDIILDKQIRLRDSDKLSVIRGGNKELLDGIQEIVLQTRQQLGDYANAGNMVWLNFISGMPYEYEKHGYRNNDDDYLMNNNVNNGGKTDQQKVYVVNEKLKEIMILMNPVEYISSQLANLKAEDLRQISFMLEEQFADEITALYYIHLFYEYAFYTRMSLPAKYYSSLSNSIKQFPTLSTPKSCLSSIIQFDKNEPWISKWFYKWMEDISNLQKEIYGTFVSNVKHMNSQLPSTYSNV
jgi:hypothetical protein